VPYALIGKTVEVRLTARGIEIFYRQQRVAAHVRNPRRGHFTTQATHRPERHSAVIDLTHEKLMQRAVAIGGIGFGACRAGHGEERQRGEIERRVESGGSGHTP
jgi:hypothetical protein